MKRKGMIEFIAYLDFIVCVTTVIVASLYKIHSLCVNVIDFRLIITYVITNCFKSAAARPEMSIIFEKLQPMRYLHFKSSQLGKLKFG